MSPPAASAPTRAAPSGPTRSASAPAVATSPRHAAPRRLALDTWTLALVALALWSFALRLIGSTDQSAYMDEGTNVLTGRLLIEHHQVYAEVLNWAYGSYLWPLVSGVADMLGGLFMVRLVTALFGVVMVLATALTAARLAPPSISRERRCAIALVAGAIMAVAPTAIAVGRFGTYDAMAGAAFMAGVSLVVPVRRTRPLALLAAAGLLFIAFLAKYVVAIYFPVLCIYLVFGAGWQRRLALRNLLCFALPLFAACVAYLLVFLGPLLTLFASSLHYGDLASSDPLREYVWQRPELVVLAVAAALGWRQATWTGRLVALAGLAVILGFQAKARPDFDFWKHSIYVLYFLAPLAALNWLRVPQNTGTWRVVTLGLAALAAAWATPRAIAEANSLIDFYPNLNPAIGDVRQLVSGSHLILTDDTALRYYLYPGIDTDRVYGPFTFFYRGGTGLEAYRAALDDGYFDSVVLDGGVTPQGNLIQSQLGDVIAAGYQPVYSADAGPDATVTVYTRQPTADDAGPTEAYQFASGTDGWGGHPESGDWQPGLQVAGSSDVLWNGQPSARFSVRSDVRTFSMRRAGSVSRLSASVYVVRADGSTEPVRVGLVGWDANWTWADDDFRWLVTPGQWTTISWDLPERGSYRELGLQFTPDVDTAYLGDFEVRP